MIPFLKDFGLIVSVSISNSFALKLTIPRCIIKSPPKNEITPRIESKSFSFDKMKTVTRTMGISVNKGAIATFIPSVLL